MDPKDKQMEEERQEEQEDQHQGVELENEPAVEEKIELENEH